jgi:hypothetical protein
MIMTDSLALLVEKEQVLDVVNKMFISTDRKDWPAVMGCFSDEVLFDMTSVTGGEPQNLTSRQIVDGWASGLKDLKAIHHQVGNYLVTVRGDESDVFCYGIALHYRPNRSGENTKRFVGSYDFHLKKQKNSWHIDRFRFNLKFIDGNVNLGLDA